MTLPPSWPGPTAQLVGSLTADPGAVSLILAPPLTIPAVVIDLEIISSENMCLTAKINIQYL